MATREQIRDRAANLLGILPFNQSLPPEHDARVTAGYAEAYATLKQLGLAVWPYEGEAPAQYVPHLAALAADNCLNDYSVSEQRYARIKQASATAAIAIRALVKGPHRTRERPRDF